ncbi:MAG: NAD-dependent epimerase/dehydratase family protein [Betaproteobacteria bacterium]|nr:NAD-dependent epimerase/dehydratase family protein [Betaproteobacteria bacterium]
MKGVASILLVGCGDIARRVARRLRGRYRIYGLARSDAQAQALRELGVRPIPGDLDDLRSLTRLALSPQVVFHFAPPPATGAADPRSLRLLAALGRAHTLPRQIIYISTSGVYGHQQGAWVDETTRRQASSPRGQRRVAAEDCLRHHCRASRVRLGILRAPGIYAEDRLPLDRLRAGTPVLFAEEDVYTNHIHAEDLARAAIAAMRRARGGRAFNACDDAAWPMGEWFDRLADAFDLPRPPRVSRAAAPTRISTMQWSFMRESRRLRNTRLTRELGLVLDYPTPETLLARLTRAATPRQRTVM